MARSDRNAASCHLCNVVHVHDTSPLVISDVPVPDAPLSSPPLHQLFQLSPLRLRCWSTGSAGATTRPQLDLYRRRTSLNRQWRHVHPRKRRRCGAGASRSTMRRSNDAGTRISPHCSATMPSRLPLRVSRPGASCPEWPPRHPLLRHSLPPAVRQKLVSLQSHRPHLSGGPTPAARVHRFPFFLRTVVGPVARAVVPNSGLEHCPITSGSTPTDMELKLPCTIPT